MFLFVLPLAVCFLSQASDFWGIPLLVDQEVARGFLKTEERTIQRQVRSNTPRGVIVYGTYSLRQVRDKELALRMTLWARPLDSVVDASNLIEIDLVPLKKRALTCAGEKEARRQINEIMARVRLGFEPREESIERLETLCRSCLEGHLSDAFSLVSLKLTTSIEASTWREIH